LRSALTLLVIAYSAGLVACSSAPEVMQYFPRGEVPASLPVWPEAPAVARLEYAGVLIGDSNFTKADGTKDGAGRRFLRWVTGLGGGDPDTRQLLRPQSGVVDPSGRILITDAGLQAIVVFDEADGVLLFWSDAGDGATFLSPVGIAVRPDGSLLVADAELGFVSILAADGTPLGKFGGNELRRPTGLAVDPTTGEVYVSDTGAHAVKVFNSHGQIVRTLGRHGMAPGEFNGPSHLKFDAGRLFVTDTFNARVQVLTPSGEPLAELGERGLFVGNLVRPKGVTTDSDGNVYVVESYYDHLLVFDSNGNLLLPIGGTGNTAGRFFLPAGIWSDSQDRIFIADMFNGRVVMLQYRGG